MPSDEDDATIPGFPSCPPSLLNAFHDISNCVEDKLVRRACLRQHGLAAIQCTDIFWFGNSDTSRPPGKQQRINLNPLLDNAETANIRSVVVLMVVIVGALLANSGLFVMVVVVGFTRMAVRVVIVNSAGTVQYILFDSVHAEGLEIGDLLRVELASHARGDAGRAVETPQL